MATTKRNPHEGNLPHRCNEPGCTMTWYAPGRARKGERCAQHSGGRLPMAKPAGKACPACSGTGADPFGMPGEPCTACAAPRPDALALLVGCEVTNAIVRDETLFLTLKKPGVRLHAFVSRDPEENGPGTLHVYDADQRDRFVACVGGR